MANFVHSALRLQNKKKNIYRRDVKSEKPVSAYPSYRYLHDFSHIHAINTKLQK